MDLSELLEYAVHYKASDLHLTVGRPPMVRISGRLIPSGYENVLTAEDTKSLIYSILTDDQKAKFEEEHELDFSLGIPGVSRFRVNVFIQRGNVAGVFRTIGENIPTAEQLGLSEQVCQLALLPRGLFVVTGPTGSGKSTTLAALIQLINSEREGHIVTIEDPIEFVHPHNKCTVNQRELGTDTFSVPRALKAVLREDPNVVLVGEMRDLETIAAALTLAETGHLVLSTLHTQDASQTVDRIIDVFPPYQQEQIRVMLAATLKGVVSQILLPLADGSGRVAARETLIVTPGIAAIIREGKTHQIYSAIQTGGREGMVTMEQSLANLVRDGLVSAEDAMGKANHPEEFRNLARLA
ncbi:MAG TPA: type IV pilus twitching motility protein PilT [Verrucomicrobiota bacterium]|nr:type IV pili twitching motility protein PilT [Verrucomicrobiales bacterium]HRI13953.1 type IV pilus twitching motility protein PilT [Verrucomicrobiota bacterium]